MSLIYEAAKLISLPATAATEPYLLYEAQKCTSIQLRSFTVL